MLWHCVAICLTSSVNCRAANYWYSGFIRLQSRIDAAIIQVRQERVPATVLALLIMMNLETETKLKVLHLNTAYLQILTVNVNSDHSFTDIVVIVVYPLHSDADKTVNVE